MQGSLVLHAAIIALATQAANPAATTPRSPLNNNDVTQAKTTLNPQPGPTDAIMDAILGQEIQGGVQTTHGGESSDHTVAPVNENLLAEMSRVIEELRMVAESMKAARQEHSHLELAVAQISTQVRDINEHNVHIKKKVRKMSKALNRSTHHHKVKDSLKLLQRDHQRILHAMVKPGSNMTHHHHNHSMNHSHNLTHNHTGKGDHFGKGYHGLKNDQHLHLNHHKNNNHSHKHDHEKNITKELHKIDDTVASTVTPTTTTVKDKHEKVEKDKGISLDGTGINHKDDHDLKTNRIPELVVDPPEVMVEDKAPPLPQDCLEVIQRGNYTSGVYVIQPKEMQPFKVWCDHTSNGGGWTIIIARKPQSDPLSFNKNWDEYKKGFGKPTGEQWIGLEALHQMTRGRKCELRVNITDFNGDFVWSEWKDFSVSSESESYSLKVARFTSASSAGDALKWHNNMKFSTPDKDNDALLGGHCASKNSAGWWYRGHRGCFQAHPTGRYQKEPENTDGQSKGPNSPPILVWQNWRGKSYFPKELYLMFRPGLN